MTTTFTEAVSQGVFAGLIGVAQPVVSGLVARGVLREGGTVAEWVGAYAQFLRDQVHGRGGDVGDSRRRLYDAQRQKLDIDNRLRSGRLVEGESVRGASLALAQSIGTKLDNRAAQLPNELVGRSHHEIQRHLVKVFSELRAELAVDAEALAVQFAPQEVAHG